MIGAIRKLRNGVTKILDLAVMIFVTLLVLDVLLGVGSRYIYGEQVKWTEELARFLLIWVVLLGGAVAFGTKGHLGVDYFVGKLHPDARKLMEVVVHLLVLFFAISIFIVGGTTVVRDALQMEQTTPALHWMMGYVYMALPISGSFMIIYTIENLIETFTSSNNSKSSESEKLEDGSK